MNTDRRREFPTQVRTAAWDRCGGYCEGIVIRHGVKQFCAAPIDIGGFHYDHINPDWMCRDNSLSNVQVLCLQCHKLKTRHDKKAIAKTKRIIKKQAEGRSSRYPLPFGRRSPLKKKITGQIIPRTKRKKRHGR